MRRIFTFAVLAIAALAVSAQPATRTATRLGNDSGIAERRTPSANQALSAGQAQGVKKVSVMGDSYSTFQGAIPQGYANYYPSQGNDVSQLEQTWWKLYVKAMGYELDTNDSWSGSTICHTGYGRQDYSGFSFLTRVQKLGDPDIIFLFGGTNDSWSNAPIGEYQYANWSKKSLYSFRPALACLLARLKETYPNAQIYAMLNSELKAEVNESFRTICKYYNVPLIELHDIEKQGGHPSIKGMQAICDQLVEATR